MPPLVSSDSAVNDAIRQKRTSDASTGSPSPVTNAGASSDASMPSARRSSRQRSASGPVELAERRRRRTAAGSGAPAAPCAGTACAARAGRPAVSPGNASENALAAVDRGVDLRARVVVLEDDVHRPVRDGADGGGRVRRHQEREVRRALRRGEPQAHRHVVAVHDAGADEAERGDRLVELRVVDRAQRLEDPGAQVHAGPSTSCASSWAAGSPAAWNSAGTSTP